MARRSPVASFHEDALQYINNDIFQFNIFNYLKYEVINTGRNAIEEHDKYKIDNIYKSLNIFGIELLFVNKKFYITLKKIIDTIIEYRKDIIKYTIINELPKLVNSFLSYSFNPDSSIKKPKKINIFKNFEKINHYEESKNLCIRYNFKKLIYFHKMADIMQYQYLHYLKYKKIGYINENDDDVQLQLQDKYFNKLIKLRQNIDEIDNMYYITDIETKLIKKSNRKKLQKEKLRDLLKKQIMYQEQTKQVIEQGKTKQFTIIEKHKTRQFELMIELERLNKLL